MASTRSGSLAPLDSDRPLRPVRGTTRRAMTTPTADEPRDCVEPGMPLLFGAGRWVDDRRSGGQLSVEHRSGDQGPPEECGWCCPRHRPGWSAMLSVRGLTVEVGGTLVVEGAAFTVRAGRGLDTLTARLEELRLKMEAQPGDHALVTKWSKAHDRFEHADGYAAEAEAKRLLAGLGLRQDRADTSITVLSGGERRRVELARILFAGSDLLLLDEPTNHLDNDAREWLFGFLRSYRGALIIISHDLELLDESITRVLHLDRPGEADVGELTEYKGTYSQYRVARARDEALGGQSVEGQLRQRPGDPHRAHPQRGGRRTDGPARPAVAAPRSTTLRPHHRRGGGAVQVVRRRPARVRGRELRRRARRAAAGARAQRRRQDQPAAHPGRNVGGRRRGRHLRPSGDGRLLRAGA